LIQIRKTCLADLPIQFGLVQFVSRDHFFLGNSHSWAKPLRLFNHNSVLSEFCAKNFIAKKSIEPLHLIIEIPLFAILFDLFLLYYLFLVCRSSRRERDTGEFSRPQLQRSRAAASRICRQVSLTHIVPVSYSIYRNAC
jgi:hypothetical protein